MRNLKVKDFMTYDLTFVFENDTVEDVVDILHKTGLSGLCVVDSELRVVGFVSEDDIIKACLPSYFNLLQTAAFLPDTNLFIKNLKSIAHNPIGKYATKPVFTVKQDDTLLYVADMIMRKGFKMVPVVDENNVLLGYVTRVAILQSAINANTVEEIK
ncbi:CBS domain-containing protein [Fervidobacterium changbaicum]|uniref:CBS domain-containing protein n=2 Tax=Fervidobacterium TaxID=2422 RepID=A0AAI8CLL7_FERIS|nr:MULTISPECIES: CBS domain-containing protein [Fervidobacterium]AMW32765.1 CBS domain-containing protein [Fervidobacterium islandicum]QAV32798.1 CBS domain-containing protein [Fervidobacterium changbaicum]SDG95092.1 CBS domain-containing protein [Fervidobacterium changbaicum]